MPWPVSKNIQHHCGDVTGHYVPKEPPSVISPNPRNRREETMDVFEGTRLAGHKTADKFTRRWLIFAVGASYTSSFSSLSKVLELMSMSFPGIGI
jgi:hypothetical protein